MKKNVIALLLSVVLAVGSISSSPVPVFAVETTTETTSESIAEESAEETIQEERAEEVIQEERTEEIEQEEILDKQENAAEEAEETSAAMPDIATQEETSAPMGDIAAQEETSAAADDVAAQEETYAAGTQEETYVAAAQEETYVAAAQEESYAAVSDAAAKEESIPEETMTIGCGGPYTIEYDHDVETYVTFEVDSGTAVIDWRFEDSVVDFSTNTARCLIFANGAGEGTIKAMDGDRVLKIYHLVIDPGYQEATVQKGDYVWTNITSMNGSLSFTECDGVSIRFRKDQMNQSSWGYLDYGNSDYLFLYDCLYAVKGEKIGDYTVKYGSEESPYLIVTYHVVDGSGQGPHDDPDQGTEETMTIGCGGPYTIEYDHDVETYVTFEVDSGTAEIDWRYEDSVGDYTKNVARCLYFASGAGEATIKAVDSTGEVLKTYNLIVVADIEEVTVCKGFSAWTYITSPNGSLQYTECDGVNVQLREGQMNQSSWGYLDPGNTDYLFLYECSYAVTGKEVGDYTVTYYTNSETSPYCIATYHVIDHDYHEISVIKEPTCAEEGIAEIECTMCHQKTKQPIPATGQHTWKKNYTVDTEPTYDEEGVESIHCSVCDTIKKGSQRVIPKLPKPMSMLTVSVMENKIYNGEEQKLDLVVIDGDVVLVEGTDYTVKYKNNINVGIATVYVTGIGHYTGTYTGKFHILPAASSKVTCTNVASGIKVSWNKVEGATSYFVYRDDKLLFRTSALEVTDKEVKYNSGIRYTYRVIASAKGVGNSTKSRTAKMFRLMPVGIKSLTNPSAGKMTVTYDKCKGCYGYVVRYGLKKDMSDANVITVKGENTLSRTFSGMKKGKAYYVQVRTYMLEYGVRYYSGYCTTKTITIKK